MGCSNSSSINTVEEKNGKKKENRRKDMEKSNEKETKTPVDKKEGKKESKKTETEEEETKESKTEDKEEMEGEEDEDEDLVEISPYDDAIYANLVSLYFYSGELDEDTLRKNLEETVKEFPLLSSVSVKKEDGTLFFKNVTPSNVSLRFNREIDDEMYDYFKPNEDGILPFEEGSKFFQYLDSIEVNTGKFFMEPALDAANLKITVLVTKTTKKSVICVSINHGIADAHTLTYFMRRWSLGKDEFEKLDGIKNFNLSREGVMSDPSFDDEAAKSIPEATLKKLGLYHPFRERESAPEDIGLNFTQSGVLKAIHFSQSRIDDMKKEVISEGRMGDIFSSNDCVSSHLHRLSAVIGKKSDDTIIPFQLVINFRGRSAKDKSYMGNGVICPSFDFSKKELLDMSFGDHVFEVRELINFVNQEQVQLCANLIKHHKSIASTLWRKKTLVVDDWRILDLKRPGGFGDQENLKCERVVLHPPQAPFFCTQLWFVKIHPSGDGLSVLCTLEKDDYEKIKHLGDLSDPQVISKIDEVFNKED